MQTQITTFVMDPSPPTLRANKTSIHRQRKRIWYQPPHTKKTNSSHQCWTVRETEL